jgi:hypothetical protein
MSTWKGELCLLTMDNAFIYFRSVDVPRTDVPKTSSRTCSQCAQPEVERIGKIYFAERSVAYEDYWRCIIRGIEYILDLRLLAQLIAVETTRYVARLAEKIADNRIQGSQVGRLRKQITSMTRLLSHLRDASIPRFIAPADYAARKFDYLIEISGIQRSIEHAGSNIQEANALLQHYESMLAQQQATRSSIIFSVIAAALSLLVIPSYLIDWHQFGQDVLDWPIWAQNIIHGIGLSLAVFFFLLSLWFGWTAFRGSKRRSK